MKWFYCFLFLSLAYVASGHAALQEDPVTSKILENQDYCVRSCEGNKIYLNTDKIHANNGRLYIDLNGEEGIVVPYLNCDQYGEYILAAEIPKYFCENNHPTDRRDGRCYDSNCRYYCGSPNRK